MTRVEDEVEETRCAWGLTIIVIQYIESIFSPTHANQYSLFVLYEALVCTKYKGTIEILSKFANKDKVDLETLFLITRDDCEFGRNTLDG